MNEENYIDVAVFLPVNGAYTYLEPEHLKGALLPGMRVLVPFGRRRITGYVLSGTKKPEDYRVKPVLELLDDIPLFPESMVAFFKWISSYYIYPLGEVVKTALPVGLNQYDVSILSLSETIQDPLNEKPLSAQEEALVSLLKAKGPLSVPSVEARLKKKGIKPLAVKMADRGLLRITSELKKDRVKIKAEPFARCGTKIPDLSRLSKKRQQLFSMVRVHQAVSLKQLKETVATAPKLARLMAEDGYLEIFEQQVIRDPLGDPVDPDVPPELTPEQGVVVDQLISALDQGFQRYLLSGVTGSGKTEVYLRLVQAVVDQGKSAVVLVPEISLISQTERRFRARFGNTIAVLHSGLSPGEVLDQWHRILRKEVSIVIGARSAIFAPVEQAGIIIVDEEHDGSYKQETGLHYNARDLAVVRARIHDCTVLLGSATPSLQSYYNCREGKFKELTLKRRVNKNPLPEIRLVDLKNSAGSWGSSRLITPELSTAIRQCLERGEQALIFLNRRGFATFPVCESCGETLKCRFCDLTMTFHKDKDVYRCHLCGFQVDSAPTCRHCHSDKIKSLGFGTQRIEELLKSGFPDARIARLDQDTCSKKGAMVSILKRVRHRTVDIIVGTQMLAKGHDFPYITLVGIICADLSLNFPDFRAGERTFQLLAQVAGRAGRGERKGIVIMQTYNPDHFSIEASKNQDVDEFCLKELSFRKALLYPPFSRMTQLILSGRDKAVVEKHAAIVGKHLQKLIENDKTSTSAVQLLGPIEAGIPKIASRYRYQILLKSPSAALLNRMITNLAADVKIFHHKGVNVAIDVDPYFMM